MSNKEPVHPPNLVTTQITAMVDDRDEYIHEQILKIFNHQNAVTITEYYCSDGTWDRLHPALFNAGLALVKANAHRRNYHKLLPDRREWADKTVDKKAAIDSQVFAWDLGIELEGCLVQLKSALDSFAKAIGLFYGFGADGFHKGKDGNGDTYSGQKIIKALSNLGEKKKPQTETLVQHIENRKKHLTLYIETRDLFTHPGKPFMEVVSGFYYDKTKQELIDPVVGHGKNPKHSYYQKQYVDEAFDFFSQFISDSIACMFGSVVPGIGFEIDESSKYRYSWNV